MKKTISIIILAIALITAPVCYKLLASKKLTPKRGLSASAHVLTNQEECKKELGKYGDKLVKNKRKSKRIYPIKIDITNRGLEKKQLALQKANIELASERKVYRKIHDFSLWKVIGVGAGVFTACTAIGVGAGFLYLVTLPSIGIPHGIGALFGAAVGFLGISALGVASGIAAAPAAILIFEPKLRKKNKHTENKAFGSELFFLEAGQTQTLYLFVEHKNFKENIELTFKDGNGNEETFSCQVSLS